MKMQTLLPAMAIAIYSIPLSCSAQSPSAQRGPRLPTVQEARDNTPPAIQLEAYQLGSYRLQCSLPDGSFVEVSPVADGSGFSFHAIRSKKGPLILINEQAMGWSDVPYKVFSFYRECALHALIKVQSEGPGHKDDYPRDLIKSAECLAVIPTQKTLGKTEPLSLMHIQSRLADEFGSASSTSAELERCYSVSHVRNVISQSSAES